MQERLAFSGVAGLDRILHGGFQRNQVYVIQGAEGTGKTTLGLQFLLEGARAGQRGLYAGFAETPQDLQRIARSHGWALDGVTLHCLAAQVGIGRGDYTLFAPSDVELHGLVHDLLDLVGAEDPERLVIDPISALRWFAGDYFEYRRCAEGLCRMLAARGCTTLLLDEDDAGGGGWSAPDGVLALAAVEPALPDRRQLRVVRLRGAAPLGGWHAYRIATGGVAVSSHDDSSGSTEPAGAA